MLLPATKLLESCTCELIDHISDTDVCIMYSTIELLDCGIIWEFIGQDCVNGMLLPATKSLDVDCICEITGHIWDVDVGEREPKNIYIYIYAYLYAYKGSQLYDIAMS